MPFWTYCIKYDQFCSFHFLFLNVALRTVKLTPVSNYFGNVTLVISYYTCIYSTHDTMSCTHMTLTYACTGTHAHTHSPAHPCSDGCRGLTRRHVSGFLEQNTAHVAGVRAAELRPLVDSTGQEAGWAHGLTNLSPGHVLLFLGSALEHLLLLASPTLPRSPLHTCAIGTLSSCRGEVRQCLGPSPDREALHKCLLDKATEHRGSRAPSGVAGPPGWTPPAPAPRVSQTPLVVGFIFPTVCSGTMETTAGWGTGCTLGQN